MLINRWNFNISHKPTTFFLSVGYLHGKWVNFNLITRLIQLIQLIILGRELVHNCKHGILQYTIVRPLTTVISIICQLNGVYGESEFKLTDAYIYILMVITNY